MKYCHMIGTLNHSIETAKDDGDLVRLTHGSCPLVACLSLNRPSADFLLTDVILVQVTCNPVMEFV